MRMLGVLGVTFVLALGCGKGGDDDAEVDDTPTMQQENCQSFHECVNGFCECTTPGIEGSPCDEDACAADCEVCT